ncbi:MAG: alpha/beta fold hydrolase [Thermomicrobiales bacterium]
MSGTAPGAFSDVRCSRRSAVGRLAGAGVIAAMAAMHLGVSRGAAQKATQPVRSSVTSFKKGTVMTDSTPTANRAPLTVALVHGAFADASGWNGVIKLLEAAGVTVTAPPNPLRGIAYDAAYIASFLNQIPGPVLLVGHSYGGAVITNAGSKAKNAVGLVYVAGLAPDEGENLLALEKDSRDSVVLQALIPFQYPTGNGKESATEFVIDPARVHEVFAADLPESESAVIAATQRPIAEATFSEPTTAPAWKELPTWAVVATGDKTLGTDVVRFCAERAKATITEVEGSHVIMISQPQAVTDVIMAAIDMVA